MHVCHFYLMVYWNLIDQGLIIKNLDPFPLTFKQELSFWMHRCVLPTLHYGHQSSADSRHHISQEPLFNFVDSQPSNDG